VRLDGDPGYPSCFALSANVVNALCELTKRRIFPRAMAFHEPRISLDAFGPPWGVHPTTLAPRRPDAMALHPVEGKRPSGLPLFREPKQIFCDVGIFRNLGYWHSSFIRQGATWLNEHKATESAMRE
jgi:hypothetical protein